MLQLAVVMNTSAESLRLAAQQPCWNAEALTAYTQSRPDVGMVACTGCVANPVVGNICSATADGEPICGPQDTTLSTGEAVTPIQVPGFRLTEPQPMAAAA